MGFEQKSGFRMRKGRSQSFDKISNIFKILHAINLLNFNF